MIAKFSSNGTAYELSGPVGAPLIAFIHGLGLNRHAWQWHERALSTRYRVLKYDLFGHGDSLAPPVSPSLSLFSDQLRGLLDELGVDICAIIGFSLGGMINRRFCLDHPQRVAALVILNSPHERSPEAQKIVEERAARTEQGGPAATIDSTLERWFTPEFMALRPKTVAQVRQWVLANNPVTYSQCREVLAKGVLELVRPDPPIESPALVITAENDSGSTPAMTQAIGSEIVSAETIIVPRLQHMGLVEEPPLFIEPVARFLDKVIDRPMRIDQ